MDLNLYIQKQKDVTKASMLEFLSVLNEEGFLNSKPIEHLFIRCPGDRSETRFEPGDINEVLNLIEDKGVDNLSISFTFKNHYEHSGRPSDIGHLSEIMYSLNIASGIMADEMGMGDDPATDFYLGVYFENTSHQEEDEEIVNCGLKFGGEGGYVDDLEEGATILSRAIEKDCPKYGRLLEIMNELFGETTAGLDFNDF